jgi:hypothetical protein
MTLKALKELRESVEVGLYDDERGNFSFFDNGSFHLNFEVDK